MIGSLLIAAFLLASTQTNGVTLGDYTHDARLQLESRVRAALKAEKTADQVSGTVTCAAEGSFFIQGHEDALKVVAPRLKLPQAGDVVCVHGSPSLEGGRVVFLASSWEKTGTASLPTPEPADEKSLTSVPTDKSTTRDVNWLRVKVQGRILGTTSIGYAIEVESLPVTIQIADRPAFLADCDTSHPIVSVVGVAELLLDQATLFGRDPYVMGVKLHVNSADDIEIKPDLRYLMNRHDQRVRWAILAAFTLLVLGFIALIALIVRQARRQLRTKTLMTERKRMADDLHDTIEQHLVGAGMLLQLNRTKEARDVLLQAKREMRDIVWGLKNDDMMRLTPAEMIRQFAHEETKKGLYRVSTKLEGLPEHLPAPEMRDLSLILREAVGNAVKHGQAKKIAVSSDPLSNGGWVLRIANDGTPFDPAKAPGPTEGHFGLEGMKARGRRLGANVEFYEKGGWTVLKLEVVK